MFTKKIKKYINFINIVYRVLSHPLSLKFLELNVKIKIFYRKHLDIDKKIYIAFSKLASFERFDLLYVS